MLALFLVGRVHGRVGKAAEGVDGVLDLEDRLVRVRIKVRVRVGVRVRVRVGVAVRVTVRVGVRVRVTVRVGSVLGSALGWG